MPNSVLPRPDEQARLIDLRRSIDADEVMRQAEGVEVHFVGGAVRDALLGRPPRDVDLAVASDGARLAARLAARLGARLVRLGGERFASYRLVAGARVIDLWDREGAPLLADLERRDFTLDAMALPLTAGAALIDPHDGLADLRAGCLRATAPTVFRADPLRVLRLARLVGEMEGAVAEVGTLALARAASAGLTGVAAERIREELERLLASPHAAAGLATLEAAGGGWALIGTAGSAAAAAAAVGELDQALTFLAAAGFRLTGEELRLARLARLALAAAPRDANRLLEQLAAAGRITRHDARAATRLVSAPSAGPQDRDQRRFLHSAGKGWRPALAIQLANGKLTPLAVPNLVELERDLGDELRAPRPLLRGHELADLTGLAKGPQLGALVAELRGAQVDGLVNTRDQAIAWLAARGPGRSTAAADRTCRPGD